MDEVNTVDAEIIPVPGGGTTTRKFTGILGAISQIQQFYVIENLGQEIPDEFLTLEGQLNYFNCGFGSGFIEGLTFAVITAILLPVLSDQGAANAVAQYFPLVRYKAFLYTVNCMPIIIFCCICCYLSKYRVGKLTKKAVDNLLIGRLFSMAMKGGLIFAGLIMLSNAINQKTAWGFAKVVTFFCKQHVMAGYRITWAMKPMLLTTAYEVIFIFTIATLVPFFTIWLVSLVRAYHKKRVDTFWHIES